MEQLSLVYYWKQNKKVVFTSVSKRNSFLVHTNSLVQHTVPVF